MHRIVPAGERVFVAEHWGELWVVERDRVSAVTGPDGAAVFGATDVLVDDDGALWVAVDGALQRRGPDGDWSAGWSACFDGDAVRQLARPSVGPLHIATDHAVWRARADADACPEKLGEAHAASDLLVTAEGDVHVLELHGRFGLPGIDGVEATRRIKRILPDVAVVMITVYEDPSVVIEAICAGADGYLLKRSSASELVEEVRHVGRGGAPLTPRVAKSVLSVVRALSPDHGRSAAELSLSPRQREVLRGLVDGRSYKQVAADLEISIDTVRGHIRRLYRKLQVHSVAEAITRALRERLV